MALEQGSPEGSFAEPLLEQNSEKDAEQKVSVPRVAVNLANAIVGAGIVGLPGALKDAGFGFGCALLTAMAVATHLSVSALVAAAELLGGCEDYGALARQALGPKAEVTVLFGQFVFDVGAALTYLIILGDTSVAAVKFGVANPPGILRPLCILGAALLMLPLCLFRDVSSLEKTSALSILAVAVVAVAVVAKLALSPRLANAGDAMTFLAKSDEGPGVVVAVGVLAFAFVCQDSCFLFYRTLEKRTPARFRAVTALALGGSAFLTLIFAAAGYLCFRENTEANLLNNFDPGDATALMMRLLYALTMIFTYPTAIFVCRQAGHALQRAAGYARGCPEDVQKISRTRHLAWSLGLWGSTVAVALATSDLGAVMALTGSVAGSLIGFVVPGFVAVCPKVQAARPEESRAATWLRRVAAAGLVVFGVLSAALSVWVVLAAP